MAKAVLMPQAGISVESCIMTEWLKQPGERIVVGDVLFRYETDKASFECESTEEGVLLEQFFSGGDEVPVLSPVCALGEPGEDVSELRSASGGEGGAGAAPAFAGARAADETAAGASAMAEAAPAPSSGEIRISPRARALAEKHHADLSLTQGTGPYGRVIERDIRALLETGLTKPETRSSDVIGVIPAPDPAPVAANSEYDDLPLSGIRKVIAAGMTRSLSEIPQLTHHHSFDASELIRFRELLKTEGASDDLGAITLGDMILYAVSRLLLRYPDLNAHMTDAVSVRRFRNVHLAFACDTERGLMVPVVRCANRKSLAEISAEVRDLAARAKTGALSPDLMTGGTFTVSNLGALGVESFTPVINPPQTGILGVCGIVDRPRRSGDGIALYPAMGLSLTYDHRAIDGAPASRFLRDLCQALERFPLLLAR